MTQVDTDELVRLAAALADLAIAVSERLIKKSLNDADHRREEIARMLAGAEITAEARAAAERLLKAAS